MKTLLRASLFLLLTSTASYGQLQTNWWFFGTGGGLQFTSGSPVPAPGGMIFVNEGSSSVSDPTTGNLLFYSDGMSAWDASHTVMPNGFGLMGNSSSTMSCLIVPWPGSTTKYYVFTTDCIENSGINGFRYSVVDMTLNSGMGDVVAATKNTLLFAPCSEQISAVKHANCIDWWVMAKESANNTYRCYLLTAAGISGPVTTSIGLTISSAPYGQGKFSPDGSMYGIATNGLAQLFDFDNLTGVLSNPTDLMGGTTGGEDTYGLSFSGDNSKIYVMRGGAATDLWQYDVTSGVPATITASGTFIGSNSFYNQMHLGPDFKIYVANSGGGSTFSVINNPNTAGIGCGFSVGTVPIAGTSTLGVTNFPDSYFNQVSPCDTLLSVDASGLNPTCFGVLDGEVYAVATGNNPPFTYSWSPVPGTNDTLTGLGAGWYYVTVTDSIGETATDSVLLTAPTQLQLTATPDGTICIGGSFTFSATMTGGTSPYSYTWTGGFTGTGAGPHTTNPTSNEYYIVNGTDNNNCPVDDDTVFVSLYPGITASTSGSTQVCRGATATFTASATGGMGVPYNYTWYQTGVAAPVGAGATLNIVPVNDPTQYCVVVTDGCTTPSDSSCAYVSFFPEPYPTLSVDTATGCSPVQVVFTVSTIPGMTATADWNFGDGGTLTGSSLSTATHTYSSPNDQCYDVYVQLTSPDGCTHDTTYYGMVCSMGYPEAGFSFAPIPADVYNPQISFDNYSSPDAINFDWTFLDDSTTNILGTSTVEDPSFVFPDDGAGTYPVWLVVTNANGCVDSVMHEVIINDVFTMYIPNGFTPNGDGRNDAFYPWGTNFDVQDYEFYIFDRWGEIIFKSNKPYEGWDGTHKGVKCKEDVYVWKLKVKSSLSQNKYERIGHVSLMR